MARFVFITLLLDLDLRRAFLWLGWLRNVWRLGTVSSYTDLRMDWAGSMASGTGYCLCQKSMLEDTIGHRARHFLTMLGSSCVLVSFHLFMS
jgi:hypothetical protein